MTQVLTFMRSLTPFFLGWTSLFWFFRRNPTPPADARYFGDAPALDVFLL